MNPEEFQTRRHRVTAEIAAAKVDVFVVAALPNIRYLSGFSGSNALLLLWADGAMLLTDPRYTIQARQECDCVVEIVKGPIYQAAANILGRKKWRRIGIEGGRITHGSYLELTGGLPLGARAIPMHPVVEHLRMVKSDAEQELIRRSVQLNSKAFERAVRKIKSGATENDLAAELEYQMRKLGAERAAFETIVAAGERSALPHAQPTRQPIVTNRLLLVDMGAVLAGYCSDMTRMLHSGKPGPRARALYKAVLEAQLAAIDKVRENVTANTVDGAARQVLKAHGFHHLFVHSTGHGLGLEIHEPPRIGKRDKTQLKAGMVITIEPGAYLEGYGGVRIEDTVLVTANGCQVLTPTSKDLPVF